jgi:hypothetical protein
MNEWLIMVWIWIAFIAAGVWEGAVEGRNAWAKGKTGWKFKIGFFELTKYHFFLFFIMFPMLLLLPIIIYGWSTRLFGILLSAYAIGVSIEDFAWYAFNTKIKWSDFGPKFAKHYPWLVIGKFRMPTPYIYSIIIAVASYLIFWQ